MTESLKARRSEVDEIDRKLVELLNNRAQLAVKLGKLKENESLPVYSPVSEGKILSEILEKNRGSFPQEALHTVFSEIISACRSIQGKEPIAILGERFGWMHDAAQEQFGTSATLKNNGNAEKMLGLFRNRGATMGFFSFQVASPDQDLIFEEFLAGRLHIISEKSYYPKFVLASKKPLNKGEITKIYVSHEAIGMLHRWIAGYSMPVKFATCLSMEEVSENLVETSKVAGILPLGTAKTLGLEIIGPEIETVSCRPIRCLTVSTKPLSEIQPAMKASVLTVMPNRPGALHSMLGLLKERDLNLSGIEMFRFRGKAWKELFLIDFEVPQTESDLQELLREMEGLNQMFKFIGAYPTLPEAR